MVTGLTPLDGAWRARLGEAEWEAAAGLEGTTAGTDLDPALVEAATMSVRAAPVRVEVRTWSRDRAVLAALAAEDDRAAGAVRIAALDDDDTLVPTPGVEVSAFPASQLAPEILRLFPPDVPAPEEHPSPSAFTVPGEAALVMSHALRGGDAGLASAAAELAGLDDVPPLLESLSASLRADATVTVLAGPTPVLVRRWLQCHLGWVAVTGTAEGVCHSPVVRAGIHSVLVRDLVDAWDRVLAAPGGAA